MKWRRRLALLAAGVVSLSSCGGGGGDTPPAPPPSPPPAAGVCASAGALYSIYATAATAPGKNAAAAVVGCSGAIGSAQWTQTGGPAVTLLSDKTQTIGFIAPEAGSYAFQVSFRDPGGAQRSENVSITATGTTAPTRLALRVSQSVRMGGNVSVRAWPTLAPGQTLQSITWSQIEGPAVQLDTSDSHVALFKAPDVARDTPIRLRATLLTSGGATDSDEALVLVERYAQAAASDSDAIWNGDHVSRVYAYKPAGMYAGVLASCVYDAGLRYRGAGANLCPLSRLPFLAQEAGAATPTVAQVMDRVLVSHDWLGRNFEDFLRTQDARGDLRRMLGSVTAIVLGTQVRPSFYYAVTGAIYLDGDNFWLTPEQRDTVNEAPDFRSDFDRELQYSGPWRYVQNNQSIFTYFDERSRISRGLDVLLYEAGWLMYHELGHALDFLPPSQVPALNNSLDPWGNIGPRYAASQLTSDAITASFPLTSSVMAGLGQVKFQGATASEVQRSYTPDQVAGFFSADIATDEYNYSTSREDLAMTLEEFLMSQRLGLRRDKAITDKITAASTGSTLIVRWGQRGRIGEPAIRPRTREIVRQLTPWISVAEVDALPAPLAMHAGQSWTGNLVLPAIPRASKASSAEPTLMQMAQFKRELRRLQHHRHLDAKRLPTAQ